MIRRVSKIITLSFLIAIRQSWRFVCNLYLISYQPYLTIRNLVEQKDKSQLFLLGVLAISPVVTYTLGRVIWDMYHYGGVLTSVGWVFLFMLILQSVVWGYLGYWFWRVIKNK